MIQYKLLQRKNFFYLDWGPIPYRPPGYAPDTDVVVLLSTYMQHLRIAGLKEL